MHKAPGQTGDLATIYNRIQKYRKLNVEFSLSVITEISMFKPRDMATATATDTDQKNVYFVVPYDCYDHACL